MSGRPAAFLDRDGTIIHDVNYIVRPEQIALLSGAAEAIRWLNGRDISVVVITNQSGIARGLLTVSQYEAVCARVAEVLAEHGARVDATYFCPHYPSITGPCDCRKPGRLLYDRAIADLNLDPSASMFAGDRARDVLPARVFGGAGYLVRGPTTPPGDVGEASDSGASVVDSLAAAVRRFLADAPNRQQPRTR